MRFGGLVSTSNIAKGETVTVRSDSDLLWTISLKKNNHEGEEGKLHDSQHV
ncbi:putative thiamine diphosphokinase [Helianthus annuus]|nr:putative thiamine diphosphokinase [Helianthus annuus]KAJ0651090.1 putative thiamine diphosphokinase [Helianthus annuus]